MAGRSFIETLRIAVTTEAMRYERAGLPLPAHFISALEAIEGRQQNVRPDPKRELARRPAPQLLRDEDGRGPCHRGCYIND